MTETLRRILSRAAGAIEALVRALGVLGSSFPSVIPRSRVLVSEDRNALGVATGFTKLPSRKAVPAHSGAVLEPSR